VWARGRLEHLALTTFAVEPARLRRLLPPGVEPATVAAAGGEAALVSAVSFIAHGLSVDGWSWLRFSGGHVDYRAAVRSPEGEPAAWFLGAAMSSPVAWGLRGLWAMPWHRAAVSVGAGAGAGGAAGDGRYRVAVADHRWTATIEADAGPGGEGADGAGLDGFDRMEQAANVLVNPQLGLFRGRGGRLTSYRVEHSPPPPTLARHRTARVTLFEDLGLVEPGASPHSVLLVGGFDIAVELPPRRVVCG
jgi:hypothetical protein